MTNHASSDIRSTLLAAVAIVTGCTSSNSDIDAQMFMKHESGVDRVITAVRSPTEKYFVVTSVMALDGDAKKPSVNWVVTTTLDCRFGVLTNSVKSYGGVSSIDLAAQPKSARAKTARETCINNSITPGF